MTSREWLWIYAEGSVEREEGEEGEGGRGKKERE